MCKERYTAADVIYIPHSALNNTYDDQPNPVENPYNQVLLTNIINTELQPYSKCRIGAYIYRSLGNDYKTFVPYGTANGHIKGFIEPNVGGHYYVMSGYSDKYSTASATVQLTSAEVSCYRGDTSNRNGFISLSLVTGEEVATRHTIMAQCDMGLIYTKFNGVEAWYPVSYSRNQDTGNNIQWDTNFTTGFMVGDSTKGVKAIPTGSKVRMELKVMIKNDEQGVLCDYVEGYIYLNGSTSAFAQIRYKATRGQFFRQGYSKPYVRFTRFMSLVPIGNNDEEQISYDYPDNSRLHGIMRECKLDSTPWNKDLIAFAWSVQGVNIESLSISTLAEKVVAADADECTICNRYPTHMKNVTNV